MLLMISCQQHQCLSLYFLLEKNIDLIRFYFETLCYLHSLIYISGLCNLHYILNKNAMHWHCYFQRPFSFPRRTMVDLTKNFSLKMKSFDFLCTCLVRLELLLLKVLLRVIKWICWEIKLIKTARQTITPWEVPTKHMILINFVFVISVFQFNYKANCTVV